MCKLLLRGPLPATKGKNAVEDLKHFQPGDFIAALPDDHVFGRDEKPPLFMIVSVPDMTVAEAELLCAPARDQKDATGAIAKLAPRASINLSLAEAAKGGVTRAGLLAKVTTNPLLDNPTIIGQPKTELG